MGNAGWQLAQRQRGSAAERFTMENYPLDQKYVGSREPIARAGQLGKPIVTVYTGRRADRVLDPRPSKIIWNHSPTGFEWGYLGSGPAQLALAILLDYTGDVPFAMAQHQRFKVAYVAEWPKEGWQITGPEISAWIIMRRRELADESAKQLDSGAAAE